MNELTCRKCGYTGILDEFIKDKRAKLGVRRVCRGCERARLREYQANNRDKVNEANRKSYQKHRDSRLKSCKEYADSHKEKRSQQARERYVSNRDNILKRCADYRRSNPDVQRAAKLRRRARERSLDFGITTAEVRDLLDRFDNKCALTGKDAEHLDHFIPLSTGHGGTSYGNLIPLTAFKNVSKSNRNPFTWGENYVGGEYQENFNKVVEYLAEINGLTAEEYREFVFWCFENKRDADEITEENKDSLELWLRVRDAA